MASSLSYLCKKTFRKFLKSMSHKIPLLFNGKLLPYNSLVNQINSYIYSVIKDIVEVRLIQGGVDLTKTEVWESVIRSLKPIIVIHRTYTRPMICSPEKAVCVHLAIMWITDHSMTENNFFYKHYTNMYNFKLKSILINWNWNIFI